MIEWVDTKAHALGVLVHQQFSIGLFDHPSAEFIHRLKLPGRVNVQQWEWKFGWEKRLAGKVQHNRRVFADGVQHHWVLALGDSLAHDVNALGFEALQMGEIQGGASLSGRGQFLTKLLRYRIASFSAVPFTPGLLASPEIGSNPTTPAEEPDLPDGHEQDETPRKQIAVIPTSFWHLIKVLAI